MNKEGPQSRHYAGRSWLSRLRVTINFPIKIHDVTAPQDYFDGHNCRNGTPDKHKPTFLYSF